MAEMEADMNAEPKGEAHIRPLRRSRRRKAMTRAPSTGSGVLATAGGEFQRKENLTVTNRLDADTLGKLDVGIGGASPRQPQSR